MCVQFVKMIQMVVRQRRSTEGERKILEKWQRVLITAIIHNGKVVYCKNSILLCLFAAPTIFYLTVELADVWHDAVCFPLKRSLGSLEIY